MIIRILRHRSRPGWSTRLAIVSALTLAASSCALPGTSSGSAGGGQSDAPDAVTIVESAVEPDDAAQPGDVAPADDTAEPTAETAAPAAGCAPGTGADYRSQLLIQTSFEGDLSCADFTGATLAQPDFTNVTLDGAVFANADVAQPEFRGTSLRNVDFTGTALSQPQFVDADLTGSKLTETVIAQPQYDNTVCPNGTNSDDNGGFCPTSLGDGGESASAGQDDGAATTTTVDTATTTTGDAGSDDGADGLAGCVGRYSGKIVGPVSVDVSGTLDSAGLFVVDFSQLLGAGEQAAGIVAADGSVVFTSILGGVGQGTFDWTTCNASGTWTGEVGDSGTWSFQPT